MAKLISSVAAELSGASAVLEALRAHTRMMYLEFADVGVHAKLLLVDQFLATVCVVPATTHHLY
jgi:hypothetical protein